MIAPYARGAMMGNNQRATCGVDSSADSAKPHGSQVASPAVAHPIVPIAKESDK